MLTKRNCNLPLICQVCGDTARGINFNVMSCSSCKVFFRRHAGKSKNISRACSKENNCEITQITRGCCSACRLNKCLTLGMDPDIIGNRRVTPIKPKSSHSVKKFSKTSNTVLRQPSTLSLLQNDRSILTRDEWNLLSNIVHAFETTSIILQTKELLEAQSMLPIKLRTKPSIMLNIFEGFYASLMPFVQCTSFYHQLAPDTYGRIVQNNLLIFGAFLGAFVVREIDAMSYPVFRTGICAFYREEIAQTVNMFTSNLEANGSLVKIFLMLVAFSTNCDITTFDPSKTNIIIGDSVSILKVQNIIVTMFWKYLLYQFGFVTAVQRFSSHNQYLLNLVNVMHANENSQNSPSLNKMIDDTKRVLTMED